MMCAYVETELFEGYVTVQTDYIFSLALPDWHLFAGTALGLCGGEAHDKGKCTIRSAGQRQHMVYPAPSCL